MKRRKTQPSKKPKRVQRTPKARLVKMIQRGHRILDKLADELKAA